jgi:hypothetical protein
MSSLESRALDRAKLGELEHALFSDRSWAGSGLYSAFQALKRVHRCLEGFTFLKQQQILRQLQVD